MSVPDDEVRRQYEVYSEDLSTTRREIARLTELQTRLAGLERVVEGLEMLHPTLRPAAITDDSARTQRAAVADEFIKTTLVVTDKVLEVLRNNPTRWYSVRDMTDVFAENRWDATPTAIRLALRRYAERGVADRSENTEGSQIFRIRSADSEAASS